VRGLREREAEAAAGPLWLAALSVSGDEAAAGLSLGALRLPLGLTSALVGLQAFGLTLAGLALGRAVGARRRAGAERLGGALLLALGVAVLVSALR
jgi:putative Mn2+ efflux pump MntP